MKNLILQNKFRIFFSIFLIFFVLFLAACKENTQPSQYKPKTPEQIEELKEPLLQANEFLEQKDVEIIESYISRHALDMQTTERGLYYMIYEHAPDTAPKVEQGDVVTLNYEISLLDGTLCYTSDSLGAKSFKTGQGGVEAGLEEGVLLLRQGDKARFIMKPFMAHGLLGDMNRIPPRSIIMYDVEIIDVQ